jgi:hypothetical protein
MSVPPSGRRQDWDRDPRRSSVGRPNPRYSGRDPVVRLGDPLGNPLRDRPVVSDAGPIAEPRRTV